MYVPTTICATVALGGGVSTSYWFYKKVATRLSPRTVRSVSDIRQPYDAVILLKSLSDECTSCDELNETLLKLLKADEPSDQQLKHIHSMYCHPTCAVSDYSLTVIWALIVWKYPTRVSRVLIL